MFCSKHLPDDYGAISQPSTQNTSLQWCYSRGRHANGLSFFFCKCWTRKKRGCSLFNATSYCMKVSLKKRGSANGRHLREMPWHIQNSYRRMKNLHIMFYLSKRYIKWMMKTYYLFKTMSIPMNSLRMRRMRLKKDLSGLVPSTAQYTGQHFYQKAWSLLLSVIARFLDD